MGLSGPVKCMQIKRWLGEVWIGSDEAHLQVIILALLPSPPSTSTSSAVTPTPFSPLPSPPLPLLSVCSNRQGVIQGARE